MDLELTRVASRRIAITRGVAPTLGRCELTHLPRLSIDLDLAREQHRAYEEQLAALGCEVRRIPADAAFPDCVFVEDTAIVLDECAVIARPGARSRRGETAAVAEALAAHRRVASIEAPGTLDGGDVLRVGRTLYIGLGARTNEEAVRQLRALLEPLGYAIEPVRVEGCLHLKSAATLVARRTLVIQPRWVAASAFRDVESLEIAPDETFAANALLVGEEVIYPAAFPDTARRLERHGVRVRLVDASELAKAEGGVTCCSLVLEERPV